MQNVEYKCELRDIALARTICKRLGASHIGDPAQTDTYYRVPSGRLKKRECPGEPTEYIFYERKNRARAKLSHFTIYSETEATTRFGTEPLPIWVTVSKTRELWMLGNVRIHLDTVRDLGAFLEFEALVSRSQNVRKCHEAVASLRESFDPVLGEAIACGYADLLAGELERRAFDDERAERA